MPKSTKTHRDPLSANSIEPDRLKVKQVEPKPNMSHKHQTGGSSLTMGSPLSVLTKVNKEMRSRTKKTWPKADETLPMPSEIITFSNDDLCYPKPNHNRPLSVSVEHKNKVVRCALIDQGSWFNLLPTSLLWAWPAKSLVQDSFPCNSDSKYQWALCRSIFQPNHSACLLCSISLTLIQFGIYSWGDFGSMIIVLYLHHGTNVSTSHRPKAPIRIESRGLKIPFISKKHTFTRHHSLWTTISSNLQEKSPILHLILLWWTCPILWSQLSIILHQHPQRYLSLPKFFQYRHQSNPCLLTEH